MAVRSNHRTRTGLNSSVTEQRRFLHRLLSGPSQLNDAKVATLWCLACLGPKTGATGWNPMKMASWRPPSIDRVLFQDQGGISSRRHVGQHVCKRERGKPALFAGATNRGRCRRRTKTVHAEQFWVPASFDARCRSSQHYSFQAFSASSKALSAQGPSHLKAPVVS